MMNGIGFSQPEGWEDRSIMACNGPVMPPSGVLPNFVVTQDKFGDINHPDPEERIKAFAQRQVTTMEAKLPSLAILSRRMTVVAGRPSAEVIVTWLNGSVRLYQIVTFTGRDMERVIISTATCAEQDMNSQEPVFRSIIASLRVGR